MTDAPREEENSVNETADQQPQEFQGTEENSIGIGAKIMGVFLEPAKTMKSIADKPDWLIPCIILVICTLVFVGLNGEVIRDTQVEQNLEQMQGRVDSGQMSQEQVDMSIEQMTKFMTTPIMMGFGVLQVFFISLIFTLIYLFFGNVIFGGSKKFKHYWSLNWYTGLIGAVGTLIGAFLVMSSGDMGSANIGLNFLTSGNPDAYIHKLFSKLSVFSLWSMVVAGIGLSVFTNVSRGKTIATAVGLFVAVMVGISFIG